MSLNFAQVLSFNSQVLSFNSQVLSFNSQVLSFNSQVLSFNSWTKLTLHDCYLMCWCIMNSPKNLTVIAW